MHCNVYNKYRKYIKKIKNRFKKKSLSLVDSKCVHEY